MRFTQNRKCDKITSITYKGLEYLVKRIDACKNNSEKSSTAKVCQHISCEYSMFTIWTSDGIKRKHDVQRDKDCTTFCESLREHAMKIISFDMKNHILIKQSHLQKKVRT